MTSPIEPSQWLSMLASFLLVIVLLVATLWLLRRIGGRNLRGATGRLAIVESLWVGPKQRLAIVRVDGREVLIAITQQQFTLLTALPVDRDRGDDSDEPESNAPGAVLQGRASEHPEALSTASGSTPDPAIAQRFRQLLRDWSTKLPRGGAK